MFYGSLTSRSLKDSERSHFVDMKREYDTRFQPFLPTPHRNRELRFLGFPSE